MYVNGQKSSAVLAILVLTGEAATMAMVRAMLPGTAPTMRLATRAATSVSVLDFGSSRES